MDTDDDLLTADKLATFEAELDDLTPEERQGATDEASATCWARALRVRASMGHALTEREKAFLEARRFTEAAGGRVS
jgi:hypothetical protein